MTKATKRFNILQRARQEAIKGGFSGAVSGAIQVITLMWLRTTVNYQYKYGGDVYHALHTLYNDGGIFRFYRGLSFALVQGPLSRFGSVAANEGAKEFIRLTYPTLNNRDSIIYVTAIGSVLSASWRAFLMPLDTCKTILQVDGPKGFQALTKRVLRGDISCLYQGTVATSLSTLVGHYPWFYVHNWLDEVLAKSNDIYYILLRSAFIGFVSSTTSDSISNIIRVVKTVKQSASTESTINLSYVQVIDKVYKEGGLLALFGRGLLLRLISNGIQSMIFTIAWKLISIKIKQNEDKLPNKK
eukprot:gene19307-25168_t